MIVSMASRLLFAVLCAYWFSSVPNRPPASAAFVCIDLPPCREQALCRLVTGEIELPNNLPITRELESKRKRVTRASHTDGDTVSVRQRLAAELLQSTIRGHLVKKRHRHLRANRTSRMQQYSASQVCLLVCLFACLLVRLLVEVCMFVLGLTG